MKKFDEPVFIKQALEDFKIKFAKELVMSREIELAKPALVNLKSFALKSIHNRNMLKNKTVDPNNKYVIAQHR